MAPGTSNTFVFGGYVVHKRDLAKTIEIWRGIKTEVCGSAEVELKWKHFFAVADDPHITTPLLVKSPRGRRQLAASGLDRLFQNTPIIPAIAVARKDRATDALVVQSKTGKDKLDDELMWVSPIAQFALFLSLHKARGKLWFDRLGSEKQEARRQAAWSEQLQMIRDGKCPSGMVGNLHKLLAVDEQIAFLDSETNEAVQIADFVCGVIWQAAEGDESFLARLVHKYGPNATRQGLGLVHVR